MMQLLEHFNGADVVVETLSQLSSVEGEHVFRLTCVDECAACGNTVSSDADVWQ